MGDPNTATKSPPERLDSLDAYRGFVMLAMVSSGLGMSKLQGDAQWGWLADQLEHRAWEGCTAWDLIQPSFMFIVGLAMPFAFALRSERGESWTRQFGHAVKRALTLIALGIFLDSYGQNPPHLFIQFIRVLQQIALAYLLTFLVLRWRPEWQALFAFGILGLHTALYLHYGWHRDTNPWLREDNFGRWLDLALHLPLSRGGYVTLNALSSTATLVFGVLGGQLLRSARPWWGKVLTLTLLGLAGLALGTALTPWVPMVKRLWTASFTLFAAGWTCLLLAFFYGVIDGLGWRRWSWPFIVVGMNSIAIYMVANTLRRPIESGLRPFLQGALDQLSSPWQPVLMACGVVLVQWGMCYWLYRKRIFFKV